jgi:hypothetical protein
MMNTERAQQTHDTDPPASLDRTGSAELIATFAVLAFVALTAASLFLTTPQSSQASASPQPITDSIGANEPPERPFHERYPVQPGGAPIDPPTF